MLEITQPQRITIFNFLPLLIAGAAGLFLGATMFGGRNGGNNDEEQRERERERERKMREEEGRIRKEEAELKMQESNFAAKQEQERQEELMRKRVALESAIGKLDSGKKEQTEQESDSSDHYMEKLDSSWMDNMTNYFKKKKASKAAVLSNE